MPREPEFEGLRFKILCLTLPNGECPAGGFLDSLSNSERNKMDVMFEKLGNTGSIHNREKFKKLEGSDGIFEFKAHQIRILCFFTPRREVVLAFGLRKKQDRHIKSDIQRAEKYKQDYEHRVES